MKTTLYTILILTSLAAFGAGTTTPSNTPPAATIKSVSTGVDKKSLIIQYQMTGRLHQQTIAFTNEITDFRYCRWMGDLGIAVAASTPTDDFYYAALYFSDRDASVAAAKIPAPAGKSRLLGIANTGGDSLVISAVQHRRDGPDIHTYGPDRLSGWMFIDNCPMVGVIGGRLIPFDIPAEQSEKMKLKTAK